MAHFIKPVHVEFDQEKIFPSNDRLLRGARQTLQKIAAITDDQQSRAELRSIDAVLGELARRQQLPHYIEFYRDMRALLVECLALVRSGTGQPPAECGNIERELSGELPPTLDASCNFEFIGQRTQRVMRHIASLVSASGVVPGPEMNDFLQRVTARENDFQMHRAQFVQAPPAADKANVVTAESLEAYLRKKWPQRSGLRVSNFRQLVGGFQKVTMIFDVEDDITRNRESLVLRMGKHDRFVALDIGDIGSEFQLVSFLHDQGALVAEPLLVEEDESMLGDKFFISRKAPGGNIGNSTASQGVTDGIAKSFIDAIAQVHRLPLSAAMKALPLGRWFKAANPRDNSRINIEYWRTQPFMRLTNPSPLTERLVNWLAANMPDDFTPCLVHCDYGPHNVLVHEGAVSAILDWESARIGDPAEDISWFLQSCGGQVDYDKAIAWYRDATGIALSEFSLRYYDVFGCLKTMVASGSAASMYEAHDDASIVWCDLHLIYTSYATRSVEERIRLAEAARQK